MNLPKTLYRAEQVRALDRTAIENFNIPGIQLMENAGGATFQAIRYRWPRARRIAVFCGGGNNGGDGFVIARLAHEQGLESCVYLLAEQARLKGDARLAFNKLKKAGVSILPFDSTTGLNADIIVDALLGTGLDGEVKNHWRLAIDWINRAKTENHCTVVSVDIPSGLHADTGSVLGASVNADLTVTFIGVKQGLLTGDGPDNCGELLFDDLGVDDAVYQQVDIAAARLDREDVASLLPPRAKGSHKGNHGHVLVVGGNYGMVGAARMVGEAALRAGAGKVTVATRGDHVTAIVSACPEIMCRGVESITQLKSLIEAANCVAVGPGLGQDEWATTMFGAVLESNKPLVVDADALNLLSQEPVRRDNWTLTPHPGEASRLLGMAGSVVQQDRFAAVSTMQSRYGGTIVLKGAGTLVCDSNGAISLCDAGNAGMASAGMGDVLTGVLAACVAQTGKLDHSAKAAVFIHAKAGDMASNEGQRGLMATDLLPHIRHLCNP